MVDPLAHAEELAQGLSSPLEAVRYETLQHTRGDPSVPLGLLMRALGDESWRVRKEAMHALATRTSRETVVAALAEALSLASNERARDAAAETLLSFGAVIHATLVRVLASGTAEGRRAAATLLGDLGEARAVTALTTALGDSDRGVRTRAAESLAGIGGAEAEEALIAALQVSHDVATRLTCLDGLLQLGRVPPLQLLIDAVRVPATRRLALRLLGRTARAEAARPIIESLRDRSAANREAALVALNHVRAVELDGGDFELASETLAETDYHLLREALASEGQEVVPAAMELAGWLGATELALLVARHVPHEAERRAALTALGAMGEAGREALEKAARDATSADDRVAALEALGGLDPQRALPLAREALVHPSSMVAAAGARIVATHGGDQDLASVIDCLERGEPVVSSIVEALGALGPRCADALRRHVAHHAFGAHERADAALCTVAAEVLPLDECQQVARTVLTRGGPWARMVAARTLSRMGATEALADLEALLDDTHPEVRAEAIIALAAIARLAPAARIALEPAVAGALEDDSAEVRVAAIGALCALPIELAIPELESRALGDDSDLAIAATHAAVDRTFEVSDADRLAILERAAEHDDPAVCRAAARALARMPGVASTRALVALLAHPRFEVRIASARALAGREDGARDALHAQLAIETDPLVRDAVHSALLPEAAATAPPAAPRGGPRESTD